MDDWKTMALVGGVLAILASATGVSQFLNRHPDSGLNAAAVRVFNQRLKAWWLTTAQTVISRFRTSMEPIGRACCRHP